MQRTQNRPFAFGAVILAGGSSRRMGRPKLLLPWNSTTILDHLIRQWAGLHADSITVVCAKDSDVEEELHRIRFPEPNRIINPAPERGMFSSIQCAATWPGWNKSLTHVAIVLGDQPHLRTTTLQALLSFGAAHPERICQPMRQGRFRHPVLLPIFAFDELREARGPDFKSYLEAHASQRAGFESDDPGLDSDMDTPEAYERLRRENNA